MTFVKQTHKEIHGWYHGLKPVGRRDCTSERLLINPYEGCAHDCWFCYARNYWNHGSVGVCQDYDKAVIDQLAKLDYASCGYLSPVTDPFQPVEAVHKLSANIISAFTALNLPIEFITKAKVPQAVLENLKTQEHSFGQISILTLDDNLRRWLVPGGATTAELLDNFRRMQELKIFSVCRIDPVIPFVNDDIKELEALMHAAVQAGACHFVVSCLDIPVQAYKRFLMKLEEREPGISAKYLKLYTERIGAYWHADYNYRHRIFTLLAGISKRLRVSFALCMEFKFAGWHKAKGTLEGLNRFFMTSETCEGKAVPLYVRDGAKFKPAAACSGACLYCRKALCGIEELRSGGAWKLKDYIRWSKAKSSQGGARTPDIRVNTHPGAAGCH